MSDQFAGGDGGGSLPYETSDDLDSHGTINRYHKRGHGYVDRVQARYTNDSDESTEIEVAFAVPEGSMIVEWLLPDDAEETTRAPQAIIANLPDESFDQQDILSRQDEFDLYSYDVEVPSEWEDRDSEMRPGRVNCGVEIDSELGDENELGVWILGSFAGGSGTSSDPYLIENWIHLDNVRDEINSSFELVNDLNEDTVGYAGTGDDWEPIGFIENDDATREFNGTFDGQGHEIRDLVIDYDDLDDGDIGLFASADEDSVIENLALTGSLTVTNADGTIYGGLVGNFYGVMRQCVCNVEVDVADGIRVGGMVGLNSGIIEDCYAVGDVLDGAARVGGLVGENAEIIRQSYTSCNVNGGSTVGALVGLNGGTIEESYFDGTPDNGEGTELDTDDMTGDDAPDNMSGFNFDDMWETVEESDSDATADGYPILQSIDRQTQLESQGIYGVFFTGKVTQDDNVENATVVAVNLDTDGFEGITTTDENGDYEFDLSHLDNFPYELIVAVDFEDSGGDRFGRAKTIMFEP